MASRWAMLGDIENLKHLKDREAYALVGWILEI
jgi:hypothetical protein